MTSICWKFRLAGADLTVNSKAYPALRSGVESAARTSCDRFTRTRSPAEKGCDGVRVSVLPSGENVTGPLAVPVARPKTRKLDAVIDEVRSGSSKVIEMAVFAGAIVLRTGLVETTSGCAAC